VTAILGRAQRGRGRPPLRLRGPADIIAVVPHLFGFQPSDSFVVLFLHDGGLNLSVRFDLTDLIDDTPALLGHVIGQCRSLGADRIVALLYGDHRALAPLGPRVAAGLGDWLGLGLIVDPAVGRWWRLEAAGDDPGLGLEPAAAVEAWAQAHDLLPVARDRTGLLDGLRPPSGRREEALLTLWNDTAAVFATRPEAGAEAMRAFLRCPEGPWSERDYVAAAVAALKPECRDQLWAALDRDTAAAHFAFWSGVVRHTPLDYRVVPLAILGLIAWQVGDGALMSVCQEECVRLNPDAPVVPLLTDIRLRGVHPDAWAPALAEATALAA